MKPIITTKMSVAVILPAMFAGLIFMAAAPPAACGADVSPAEALAIASEAYVYLINSPMLPGLKRDADGGLTLYIQRQSPGKDKEANWLPAPNGPFMIALRIYWPKTQVLDGSWRAPPLERVE